MLSSGGYDADRPAPMSTAEFIISCVPRRGLLVHDLALGFI